MTDMAGTGRVSVWRPAGPDEADALRDLERAANLVGLAHVFPPELPFPDEGVRARWAAVLAEPGVRVDVVDGPAGLLAFAAYDDRSLRHLAVHPDAWGRGVGRAGVERAVAAIRAGGADRALLWVLELNHRARALYDALGWVPTGRRQDCPWEPHPVELEYALAL
jgi:GNAT superfamily N-acetyltransferase